MNGDSEKRYKNVGLGPQQQEAKRGDKSNTWLPRIINSVYMEIRQ